MEVEMEQTADEIKRLQGCINDLISVLALPAIWSGHESSQIVSTLLDVLLGYAAPGLCLCPDETIQLTARRSRWSGWLSAEIRLRSRRRLGRALTAG